MKKKLGTTALLGLCACWGCSTSTVTQAAPTLITTAQGRGADLAIRGGNFAKDNFGKMDILRVRNDRNVGDARKTYLRFDLTTLPLPSIKATGATLGLRLAPSEGKSAPDKKWTFNVSALKDASPLENWDENAVSWNNAPANDPTSPLNLKGDAIPLGTFTITGIGVKDQPISFTSSQLLDLVKGDTNGEVTLIITRQEAGEGPDNDVVHIFASKEYGTPMPPVLSVAFDGDHADLPAPQQWAKLPAAPQPAAVTAPPVAAETTVSLNDPLPANAPAAQEINAFQAADKKQMPPQGAVLFIGSSTIRLWETLAQDFREIPVINRGFGGSLVQESTLYADRIAIPYKPKIIVLMAGTNDLAYGGKKPEDVLHDFEAFVAKIHAALPDTRIVYLSINPTVARWNQEVDILRTNHLIEEFVFAHNSPQEKLNFINSHEAILTPDGQPQPQLLREDKLHFNAEGYKVFTAIVKPRVMALAALDGVKRLDAPQTAVTKR